MGSLGKFGNKQAFILANLSVESVDLEKKDPGGFDFDFNESIYQVCTSVVNSLRQITDMA
jgi:hypothetical protein